MSDQEHVRIRVSIECNHVINADIEEEFDGPTKAEWAAMSEKDRREYLEMAAETTLGNNISYGADVVDG